MPQGDLRIRIAAGHGRRGRGRLRRSRRAQFGVETLECRRLPALTFPFANAVQVTGSGSVDVESNPVTNDAAGNVYVTGSLQGTANFNPAGTTNLTSTGGRDVFLAKYSQAGALVWAKSLRGADSTSAAQAGAVVVDGQGNVVITGTFTGTVDFDPNGGTTSLSSPGRNDVFIAKYDSNGALVWARDVAGTAGAVDQGYALAVDGSGNIAVAGSFQSTATFGSIALTAGGTFDSFVAKISPSGTFLWASATSGAGSSVAQTAGVTFDGSGNVIATGLFAGQVDFDPGSGVLNLPYAGSRDVFVQKLSSTGGLVWALRLGGSDIDQGNSIAADASGNLYVTGTFSGTVDFDPGAGTASLSAGGSADAFLLKLTSGGRLVWAKDLAAKDFNAAQGTGVGLDGSGNVFVAGYFQGEFTLDPSASGGKLTAAGGFDVFVGEFDGAGDFVAARSAGGADFDAGYGVGVNSSGLVAIAGRYTGPAAFGTVTLASQSGKSIFIAQIASLTSNLPPAPNAPSLQAGSDTGVSSSDRITKATTLVFDLVGVSAPGNLVELLRDGVVIGSRTGAGSITDSGPVPDGVHVYTARQTDSGGKVSNLSASTSVTVMTKAPASPSVPVLNNADDSGVKGDGITNVTRPRLTGTAPLGTTVQLVNASGTVLGTATVGGDTSYTVQPTSALGDGTYTLRVRAVDAAGNIGSNGPALTFVILTTPPVTPSAPVLNSADDTGPRGDGKTSVRRPRLVGTAVPGMTVELIDSKGVVLASTTAAAGSGSYTLQPAANLAVGSNALRVRQRDVAGNAGQGGPAINLTIVDAAPADFEGDGKSDMAVFRPANGLWAINRSSGGPNSFTLYGGANFYDIPVPGDYDGLGHSELAVFRPTTAEWIINSPGGLRVVTFGAPNLFDIPVPGDYDGVGYTEPAVFRPSTGEWFVLGPTGGRLLGTFGATNLFDIPVPGDYDGVGRTQMAVFRPSTAQWFVLGPTGGRLLGTFGAPNLLDIPVPGDYDGVGHTEPAVFRPSTAQWFVLGPTGGRLLGSFGEQNLYDIPPQAPVASLRKLVNVGGIRLASVQTAPRSMALTVSSDGAEAEPVVYAAPVVAKKRPEQDVFAAAIDVLIGVG